MLRKVVAFTLACALGSTDIVAAQPKDKRPRIASSSLCGDSYVLALAPERISALSWQSRHDLSLASAEMQALPQIWDDIEKLTAAQAEIILLGPGEGTLVKPYLERAGLTSKNLIWGETFTSVSKNVQAIGDILGVKEKAAQINDDLTLRLKILKRRAKARVTQSSVLYLSRSGGTAGSGTYIDAAIKAAGGENIIQTPGWQTLDPENIISLSPDIILTSFFEGGYESVQAKSIRHRVLVDFIKSRAVIDVPGSLWPCAGPNLIDAAEIIANGLDRHP